MALILRARERVAVPWKNGGGVTRTVAVHPPGSDLKTFDWRVSIAEVRSSGPFSVFSGVERHMAVLSGRLSLSIDGGAPVSVGNAGMGPFYVVLGERAGQPASGNPE